MLAIKSQTNPVSVPLALVRGMARPRSLEALVTRHIGVILRASLGVVFLWFGVLKLVPGVSPAEHLAGETLQRLSFGLVQPSVSLPALGGFEMALGLAVLLCPRARFTVPALLLHLAGTFTPLFLFPAQTFNGFPVPTLIGQYIIKNVVLAAAALALLTTNSPE